VPNSPVAVDWTPVTNIGFMGVVGGSKSVHLPPGPLQG
jgi:hypothetical protein